jgi:hypothetical protein
MSTHKLQMGDIGKNSAVVHCKPETVLLMLRPRLVVYSAAAGSMKVSAINVAKEDTSHEPARLLCPL